MDRIPRGTEIIDNTGKQQGVIIVCTRLALPFILALPVFALHACFDASLPFTTPNRAVSHARVSTVSIPDHFRASR